MLFRSVLHKTVFPLHGIPFSDTRTAILISYVTSPSQTTPDDKNGVESGIQMLLETMAMRKSDTGETASVISPSPSNVSSSPKRLSINSYPPSDCPSFGSSVATTLTKHFLSPSNIANALVLNDRRNANDKNTDPVCIKNLFILLSFLKL